MLFLQTRERFLSLRKGTKTGVATALEEVGPCVSYVFVQLRFTLVYVIL